MVSVTSAVSAQAVAPVADVDVAIVTTTAKPLQIHLAHEHWSEITQATHRSSSQRNLPTYHADHKNGFADAVRLNLRALPARQAESFNLSLMKQFDESPSLKSAAQVLAEHADVCETALVAFDHEIVRKSTWRLLSPQMQPSSNNAVFAGAFLPDWLTEGSFRPLGVEHSPDGQIELLTPGAITPMVLIDEQKQSLRCWFKFDKTVGWNYLRS